MMKKHFDVVSVNLGERGAMKNEMFRKVDGDEWAGNEPPLKDEGGAWMDIQRRHLRFQSDETHRHRGALPHRKRQPQLQENKGGKRMC